MTQDAEGLLRRGAALLLEAGCRRPAFLGPGGDGHGRSQYLARLRKACGPALAEAGTPLREAWCATEPATSFQPRRVWRRFERLWAGRERPDGLFVTDDLLYPEAALTLLRAGIAVPAETVVLSHTNAGTDLHCPFPTVLLAFDPVAFGRRVAQTAEDLALHGPSGEIVEHVLAPRLIDRDRVLARRRKQAAPRGRRA